MANQPAAIPRGPESEVFRFSVIRPPRKLITIDSLEAAPLPKERAIIDAIAKAETPEKRVTALKELKPDEAELDELELLKIAKAATADNRVLTWSAVKGALATKQKNEQGKDKEKERREIEEKDKEEVKEKDKEEDKEEEQEVPEPDWLKLRMSVYSVEAAKLHLAWLIDRLVASAQGQIESKRQGKGASGSGHEDNAPKAPEPASDRGDETTNSGAGEKVDKDRLSAYEAALKIAAVVRDVAVNPSLMSDSSPLDKMLQRQLRPTARITEAIRRHSYRSSSCLKEIQKSTLASVQRLELVLKSKNSSDGHGAAEARGEDGEAAKDGPSPLKPAVVARAGHLVDLYDRLIDLRKAQLVVSETTAKQRVQPPDRALGSPQTVKKQGRIALYVRSLVGNNIMTQPKSLPAADNGDSKKKQLKDALTTNKLDKVQFGASTIGEVLEKIEDPSSLFPKQIEEEICHVHELIAEQKPTAITQLSYSVFQIATHVEPVRVLGFLDLIKTTERLLDYDAREIAHIENRAAGETRERIHTAFESNENTLTTEEEEESSEEKDLQTSQRSELQNESQRTLEQQFSLHAGVKASASYGTGAGPKVQIDSSLDIGSSTSSSQSQRTASTFAKEVINKTVSSLKRRTRRTATLRQLRTTEERNRHAFETGKDATSDIYLWVEKIHEVTLKNYGKRVLLEFVIPEPGAFLSYQYGTSIDGAPPQEFTESAAEINELNYRELAHRYGAANVTPPPQEYLVVGGGEISKTDDAPKNEMRGAQKELKIPAGYVPTKVLVAASGVIYWDSGQFTCGVLVSFAGTVVAKSAAYIGPGSDSVQYELDLPQSLENEVDPQSPNLTVTLAPWIYYSALAYVNIAVICRRSCRAYAAWQIETHDKIYAAYRMKLSEYNEARSSDPMSGVKGGHPLTNRRMEMRELKRYAISILKGQPPDFDLYPESSPEGGTPTPPTMPNLTELPALRQDLDLFEECFEWNEMTFTLYPYFWGSTDRWMSRAKFNVPDPDHRDFLEAGAARVVVPATPGKERQVLNYLAQVATDNATIMPYDPISPGVYTAEELYPDIIAELPDTPSDFEKDSWRKSLVSSNEELSRDSTTLDVKQGSNKVKVQAANVFDSYLDVNREIWINAKQYFIEAYDSGTNELTLDRPYSGPNDPKATIVVGARLLGAPWQVRVPTSLVVLREFREQLQLGKVLAPAAGG
jgi:hypothetical protein